MRFKKAPWRIGYFFHQKALWVVYKHNLVRILPFHKQFSLRIVIILTAQIDSFIFEQKARFYEHTFRVIAFIFIVDIRHFEDHKVVIVLNFAFADRGTLAAFHFIGNSAQ